MPEFHAPPPVVHVVPTTTAAALLFEETSGSFGEHGHSLDTALVGERDERGAAEPEFASSTTDDEPLDPASGSGRLDEQVQAVPVRMPSWRGGTDEGGRERLVGVASPELGSAGRGGLGYNIHPAIIYGMQPDFAARPDPLSLPPRMINYYLSVIYSLS